MLYWLKEEEMTDELINVFNTALLEFNKLNRKVKETLLVIPPHQRAR